MTFVVLAAVGAACCVLAVLFEETLPREEPFEGSVLRSLGQLGAVARNRGSLRFCASSVLTTFRFMAYIAVGSYVYISFFGLSELAYSFYFALAALLTVTGPDLAQSIEACERRKPATFLTAVALCSGAAMLLVGQRGPALFCATFLVFAVTEACIRPYSTNILLSQQEGDTGAASSLINFAHTAIGCVGMVLAVLPWPNFVVGIGVIIIATMAVAGAGWIAPAEAERSARGHQGSGAEAARRGRPCAERLAVAPVPRGTLRGWHDRPRPSAEARPQSPAVASGGGMQSDETVKIAAKERIRPFRFALKRIVNTCSRGEMSAATTQHVVVPSRMVGKRKEDLKWQKVLLSGSTPKKAMGSSPRTMAKISSSTSEIKMDGFKTL